MSMTQPAIKLGETVRLTTASVVAGVPADLNPLTLTITSPSNVSTTYTYGSSVELVRDGVGQYHFDLLINALGVWAFEWHGGGAPEAIDEGTVVTGQTFTLEVVDETPAPIPFANIAVSDSQLMLVPDQELESDAAGLVELFLTPGTYTFLAEKFGYRFELKYVTLLAPGGGPAKDVTLVGALLNDTWLTFKDLERVTSVDVIDRLFQDNNGGRRDAALLQSIILEAQALAESKLLRSWNQESIVKLAFHDPAVRMNAAWIALELATERRGEFIASDGKGRYWAQYERAMTFFDGLSKSKDQSRGEKANTQLGVDAAGVNKNTGGKRSPQGQRGNNFVFADEGDGTKHGGF
jgi:hypothetical protein